MDMKKPGAHVFSLIEDFNARAKLARLEARTLVTRAEIWEDAAMRLQDATDKERGLVDKA